MRRLLLLLSFGLFFVPAFAQFTSNVQGTVTDPSGALVTGAAVTLTNTATGVVNRTISNESGQYRFLSLPQGAYTIVVAAAGFEQTAVKAVVQTEQTVGVNVKLKVGSANQSVTVTSEAAALNPEETRLEYTLESQDLASLPSQSHGTLNFIKLAPGATGINEASTDLVTNRNAVSLSANGLGSQSNLYTLDNIPINSVLAYASGAQGNTNGAIIFTPNPDSLDEISLQSATFNVDYGSAASLQVGMATKAGTNKFHGSADLTYNDKILNAPAFNQSNANANHRLIDSFSGGGPIINNHTFIFGAYEHFGSYGSGSTSAKWWTPEFQTFIAQADAQSVDVQKFMLANPATRLVDNRSNYVTAQNIFDSGQTGDCAPGGPLLATKFKIPCSMNVTYFGVAAAPGILNGKNWNLRGDQTFNNGRDRIYAFFFHMDQTSNSQAPHPTWDGETPSNGYDLTTNYTHTFTSNLLNSVSFALTKFSFQFTDTPHSTLLLQMPFDLGIWDAGGLTGGSLDGGFTRYVPFSNTERQIYGRDALIWTRNKHSFTFGIEAANNYGTDENSVDARPQYYGFGSTLNFLEDTLAMENVNSHYSALTGDFEPYAANAVNTRFGIYAEDSWKVTPHLTVNYGARWDDLGNPAPYSGSTPWANTFYTGSDPATIASTVAAKNVNSVFASAQNKNVLPRGGFAWTPKWFSGSRQLVVRGGIGLYQDLPQMQNIADFLASNPPNGVVGASFNTWGSPELPELSYGTQSTSAPYGFVFPAGPIGQFNSDNSPVGSQINLSGYDRNLAVPRSVIWNFAVEKELPASVVFSLTYAASHSYNQTFVADLNRPAGNTYCTIGGVTVYPNGTTCKSPTSHLVNSHWGQITPRRAGNTSNYDAMIAQLRQHWHNLNWQGSYTWGHTLDTPTGEGSSGTGMIELQYNPKAQYGNADGDIRHRVTASYSCQIPVPHFLKEAVGGWSLNGEVIAQSGTPFTPYYGDEIHDFSGSGLPTPYNIADYKGTKRSGWSKAQIKKGIFSDTADPTTLFTAPVCGNNCIGTTGRNQFWGPGYVTWDQGIEHKITFPWFGDGKSVLSVKAHAFNALNKVNFNNPTTLINSGSLGQPTNANQGRVMDLGARFEF